MNELLPKEHIQEEIVTALQEGLGSNLIAVVLFGSRARGDARVESDWDLLLVADELPAKTLDRHFLLKKLMPASYRGGTSILAKTPQEFEARVPSLYLDIAEDARILYDPKGYISRRLRDIRDSVIRAGFVRERTSSGYRWRKREAA